MKPFCFDTDRIIFSDEATIHPLDIGLIRGYAIFDFLRVENYQPLFLDDYLHRFISSARTCALPMDYTLEKLRDLVYILIEKNSQEEGGIRMILSGGVS